MLFNTLPQFVVLGLLLFGGLILGLGLHPGGKKWRRALDEESDEYAAYRRDADGQIREGNRRIAELERENAAMLERETRLRAQVTELEARPAPAPVAVAPVPVAVAPVPVPVETAPVMAPAPVEPVVTAPVAEPVVEEAVAEPVDDAEEPKKEWFSMGGGSDDLSRIRTVDAPLKTKLNALGVTRFADIEKLSAEDEMALEQRLDVPAGFIAREQWRDQAALLRAGKTEEHRARFWANN